MCARRLEVCPVRAKCRLLRGAFWGAKSSLQGLTWARPRSRELVFCLLRGSAALTGTVWWSMVRRRSTVRFRKGLSSDGFFVRVSGRRGAGNCPLGGSFAHARSLDHGHDLHCGSNGRQGSGSGCGKRSDCAIEEPQYCPVTAAASEVAGSPVAGRSRKPADRTSARFQPNIQDPAAGRPASRIAP
jgi:hypothetical protein